MNLELFACHCGKQFRRKEHLRRHEATHSTPKFQCEICQRVFTRGDVLRRHAITHRPDIRPAPRIARACLACHSSKTRCNGESPCALCQRRGKPCEYDYQISREEPTVLSDDEAEQPSEMRSSIAEPQGNSTNISVLSIQLVLEALESPSKSLKRLLDDSGDPNPWAKSCIDTYMQDFHIHWPAVHSAVFELDWNPIDVSASVIMIGCWFAHRESADEELISLHQKLVEKFFHFLRQSKVGSKDLPWDIPQYQAILLNIIFAFYTQRQEIIAQAALLLHAFVAKLRELRMFSSKAAEYQEKVHFPGTFMPFIHGTREARTRLVINLFKIDTYLALWNDQSPCQCIEELDIPMPCTFASWNAHGLDIFYKRFPQENSARSGLCLWDVLRLPDKLESSAWLLEDINISLCGVQRTLWQYNTIRRMGAAVDVELQVKLASQLDNLKSRLNCLQNLSNLQQLEAGIVNLALRPYAAKEEEESSFVLARTQSLLNDTMRLLNTIGLHLYSRTEILDKFVIRPPISPDLVSTTYIGRLQMHLQDPNTPVDDRRAIFFCIKILEDKLKEVDVYEGRYVEPCTYISLSHIFSATKWWLNTERVA